MKNLKSSKMSATAEETSQKSKNVSSKLAKKVLNAVLGRHEEQTQQNDADSLFPATNTNTKKLWWTLHVNSFKVPVSRKQMELKENVPMHPKIYKIILPHSLLDARSGVLLVTKDYPAAPTKRKPINYTVSNGHYTTMLKEAECSHLVSEVMGLTELKTAYSDYGNLKNLDKRIDFVLCDPSVVKIVPRLLGGCFNRKGKHPVAVKVRPTNLKDNIEQKLSTTCHKWSMRDQNSIIHFATTHQTLEEVFENLKACLAHLVTTFPGGWNNVRTLYISMGKNKVPLYISRGKPSEVPMIIVEEDKVEEIEDDIGYGNVKIDSNGKILEFENYQLSDCEDDEGFIKSFKPPRSHSKKKRKLGADGTKARKKRAVATEGIEDLPAATKLPFTHVENDFVDFAE